MRARLQWSTPSHAARAPFDILAELDKNRANSANVMILVGLIFALGLLLMSRTLKRQKGGSWGNQLVVHIVVPPFEAQ